MTETYSTYGPECPYCGHQHQADDPSYYSDDYEEDDCDGCGKKFKVEAYTSTSWTCESLE